MSQFAPTLSSDPPQSASILVVEDEQIVAMDLQEKLEGMGYAVPALAASGEEAIARADEFRPNLVLMDVHLEGEMDGVEAARIIRQRLRIPVIYLTAYSNAEVVERAKITEPFGYILKPFVLRELQIIIEMALYRARMEAKLQEREQLLAATLRSIGDGVIATDSHGRITFLNPVAERLTGWSLGEALGRPILEVFHLESEQGGRAAESPLERAIREKVVVALGNHQALVTRAQHRIPIDDAASPILDDRDHLLGGVIVFRDVTALRAAHRNREKLAAIVSSSTDAIISKTCDGVITSWNPGAERLYGYTAQEAIGQNITMLAPPEKVQEIEAVLARIRRGELVLPYDTVRHRKDGKPIEVIVNVSPLKNELGEVIGAASIARDVTELRQLEEQYRQSQKMEAIGKLAGGVAHEFNNLLTIINGYSEMILNRLAPTDKNRELLEQVIRAGERAASLTGQLLAYSRKTILQPKCVDLNELLAANEKMLRHLIREDIALRVVRGKGEQQVKVDPNQMVQVLMNLVLNALDAMPNGGNLTIETRTVPLEVSSIPPESGLNPGRHCVLTVTDTGCGMDSDTLSHIFEPFFTTKKVAQGTGLGLPMVYGTVKQSGGHIEVESLPGKGTTFRIYLPEFKDHKREEKRSILASLPGGTETVLLVEDEEGVRKLTAEVLRQVGYTVLEAYDGLHALEVVAGHKERLDLLVSDVVMPRMNGPQMAAAVKMLHPEIKVVFQSGYNDDAVLQQGIEIDNQALIQKPFTLETLARTVRQVLDCK